MPISVKPEVIDHLMSSNPQFRKLFTEHAEHKKRIEDLDRKHPFLEEYDQEIKNLKKNRLALKDRMQRIADMASL